MRRGRSVLDGAGGDGITEGLSEEVTFEQRPKEVKGHVGTGERGIAGGRPCR